MMFFFLTFCLISCFVYVPRKNLRKLREKGAGELRDLGELDWQFLRLARGGIRELFENWEIEFWGKEMKKELAYVLKILNIDKFFKTVKNGRFFEVVKDLRFLKYWGV